MSAVSQRVRYMMVALFLAWLGLVILTRPAHGAWGADPITVHATAALCPAVSAIDDGHYGALVVWQENDAAGGHLKAQHVLANGDLDPAWGDGVAVSDVDAARGALGAVSDASGGAYVWWMQDAMLFLTHVSAGGAITPGWSAHGRNLGTLPGSAGRPAATADGSGGIYLGWLSFQIPFGSTSTYVRAVHLGPAGLGVGGWPTSGRAVTSPSDPDVIVNSFGLDRASDGGVWLAWQTLQAGPMGSALPGEVRAVRLTPAGAPAGGWTADGVLLAPYDTGFMAHDHGWMMSQPASLVAAAHDDEAGAFVVSTQGEWDGANVVFHATVRHLGPAGAPAPGWTPDGQPLGDILGDAAFEGPEASMRAFADQKGGVLAGVPFFGSEFSALTFFSRLSPDGAPLDGGIGTGQQGLEFAPRGDGGMFIASFKPSGASGPYEPDAYISVAQSDPGAGWYESKASPNATRYGDVGLTATGDGGAIFAWSQLVDRQGIFAIRLGTAGQVTSVPPTPVVGGPALRVRFVKGEGVRAVASLAGATNVDLALYDLAGRRVAQVRSDATLGADVLLPGTRDLPGGVYFARASDGKRQVDQKVLVLR